MLLLPLAAALVANNASVVVPALCSRLRDTFLSTAMSIKMQTVAPAEVVVVASDCGTVSPYSYASMYGDLFSPIPFRISFHSMRMSSGHARNIGARNAKGSHILFFDDDDIMVRDYTRIVMGLFEETGAKMVLHGFHSDVIPCTHQNSEIVAHSDDLRKMAMATRETGVALSKDIAHGHVAVQAGVMSTLGFKVMPGVRGEDANFVRRVLRTECHAPADCIQTSAQLSVYVRSKRQTTLWTDISQMLGRPTRNLRTFDLFSRQAPVVCQA